MLHRDRLDSWKRFLSTAICLLSIAIPVTVWSQTSHPKVSFGGKLERPTPNKVRRFRIDAIRALRGFRASLPRSQSTARIQLHPDALASINDPAFSWRTAGYVTPSRDQNPCGSCYVFRPVGAMEANWAIRNSKQMIDSSEQHALNCVPGGRWWFAD
jgi:C1A family cysteine protease